MTLKVPTRLGWYVLKVERYFSVLNGMDIDNKGINKTCANEKYNHPNTCGAFISSYL